MSLTNQRRLEFEKTNRLLQAARKPDYSDPLTRILCAPMFNHMRAVGLPLPPEAESIANEDTTEMREHRGAQYLASLPSRGVKP